MSQSNIRFSTFPRTESPAPFVFEVIAVFERNIGTIGTQTSSQSLNSDEALSALRSDLVELGFEVESGKQDDQKIKRPVFFGENAMPNLSYEVDAWHPKMRAGLEVEAGRAIGGNAVYRDLIQALVMVDMKLLFLAVPQLYVYGKNSTKSRDFEKTVSVAEALYGHSRITMPFSLCVIGY